MSLKEELNVQRVLILALLKEKIKEKDISNI